MVSQRNRDHSFVTVSVTLTMNSLEILGIDSNTSDSESDSAGRLSLTLRPGPMGLVDRYDGGLRLH